MRKTIKLTPASPDANISAQYSMTVDDLKCAVVASPCDQIHYARFDLAGGAVEVVVRAQSVDYWSGGAVVRPLSRKIEPVVDGATLRFHVSEPCQLSIERSGITGDDKDAEILFLLVNPPESTPVTESSANVIYFGPGVHRVEGDIHLKSDQTLYVAEGAIVFAGGVRARHADNIAVRGRGVLNLSVDSQWDSGIELAHCRNVLFEGLTVFVYSPIKTNGHQHLLSHCENVAFRHYSMVGSNMNTDGIHLDACRNIVVEDGLLRCHDDCIAVYSSWQRGDALDCDAIRVERCAFWPMNQSGVCRIGWPGYRFHTRCHGFTMRDCDVIHTSTRKSWEELALVDMRADRDGGFEYHDILFENIRIEEIDVFVNIDTQESKDAVMRNVVFRDIHLMQPAWRRRFKGREGNSFIGVNDFENIRFENITLCGEPVYAPEQLDMRYYGRAALEPERIQFYDAEGCPRTPQARFETSVRAGPAPLVVEFDGAGSESPGGSIVAWEWDFGDGTTGTGERVTHTYEQAGRYEVTLTVRDQQGTPRRRNLRFVEVAACGLLGTYFARDHLANPALTVVDAPLDLNWGRGLLYPEVGFDRFSVRWCGQLIPRFSEVHRIAVDSPGGIRLWVDGKLLVDDWKCIEGFPRSGELMLEAGQAVEVVLDYRDAGRPGQIALSWSGSSQARQIIPAECLRPWTAGHDFPLDVEPGTGQAMDPAALRSYISRALPGKRIPLEMETWRLNKQMGYALTPLQDIEVKALGRAVSGEWVCGHTVRIWHEASETLVAECHVHINAPLHSSGCRYARLPTYVHLRAGETYRITSTEYEEQDDFVPLQAIEVDTAAATVGLPMICKRIDGMPQPMHKEERVGLGHGLPTFLWEF